MKSVVKIDAKLIGQLNKKVKRIAILMCVLAGILLVMNIMQFLSKLDGNKVLFLICWLFFAYLGITFLVVGAKQKKKTMAEQKEQHIEFFEDWCNIQIVKNEEVIETAKLYYKDIIKTNETEDYLFLYVSNIIVHAVNKSCFSTEEYSNLKFKILSHMKK